MEDKFELNNKEKPQKPQKRLKKNTNKQVSEYKPKDQRINVVSFTFRPLLTKNYSLNKNI